jgi:ribonuclease T2
MRHSWVQLALLTAVVLVAAYFVERRENNPELETLKTSSALVTKDKTSEQSFDFYVLSLSWSPSYCDLKGRDADREQCGGRPLGFTVHGLWPQYERGYPESCAVGEPGGVSRDILRQIQTIMPSDGLARHQWRKHGTCSGLSQSAYFSAMQDAFSKVRIPDSFQTAAKIRSVSPKQVESAFLSANPDMKADGTAVVCADGNLTEVRICLTKELAYRSCREVDSRSCRASQINLPSMK